MKKNYRFAINDSAATTMVSRIALLACASACGSVAGCSSDSSGGGAASAPESVEAAPIHHQIDRRISSLVSPLAPNCGPPPDGTFYQNGEVQPTLVADPTNPSHLIAMYQQDRWSKMGSNGILTAVSHDLGKTWTPSAKAPAFSHCTGGTAANHGDYELATDSWMSIGPTGTAFAVAFSLNRSTYATAINVSRSTDGGSHWSDPVTLIRDDNTQFFDDRPTVTADPFRRGVVYVVWDRIDDTSTDTVPHFTQPLYIARSDDDGKTWGPAHKVYDTALNTGTIGDQLTVLRDGTLLDSYSLEGTPDAARQFQVIRSTDKGETWSAPITVGAIGALSSYGLPDPDGTAVPVRNAATPVLSLDQRTGTINAVWATTAFASGTSVQQVAFAQSVDGGKTWSTPIQVNKSPTGSAVLPMVATGKDGRIGITYFDFRNNTPDPATLPTDFWLITCATNCTTAASWKESHVAGPFDARRAPATGLGIMLGDYTGLVSTSAGFLAVYTTTTSDATNPTNVMGSLLSP